MSQINTGQGIQGFGRFPGFLTPLMVCQKKIWEDSPDEGGDSVATTVEIHIVIKTTRAKSLTPYCWERTYPVLRQQHQKRAATRLRKHDSLPTAKLSQIFHSTEIPRSMNYGAIVSILYFQGSD